MIKQRMRFIETEKCLRLFLCLSLVFLLLTQSAGAAEKAGEHTAVDPVGERNSYSAVLYNNTNGLPTSEANAIAQTSEGFLWIGSYGGLVRYDGNTFERMDSTTGVTSVVSLHVDRRNRLWIGTNDNGLALMEHGEVRLLGEEDGLRSARVSAIEEDEDGTIYAGTSAGITMISPDFTVRSVDDPRIANSYIQHICRGNDGLLYCLTTEDDFFTLRKGKVVEYTNHTETSVQGITSILPDPKEPGKLYIGTENSRFYHGDGKSAPEKMEYVDISPLFSVMDIQQIGDQIWICAINGIGVIDREGFHHLSDLPMTNLVRHVTTDYEGNLWFTSTREGVMKLVPNQFSDIFARCDLPDQVVNSTCLYDDMLFVATDTCLMALDGNRPVSSLPLRSAKTASGKDLGATDLLELLDGCRIRSLILDSQGRLWISTWRACGLLRYDRGDVTAFTEADGLLSNHIRSVCETSDGSILVANSGGVSVIQGDRVIKSYDQDDGIKNPETLTVCAAPNGDILLGSDGGGIYIANKDGIRSISTKDGLSSAVVMRIKHDPARGLFWIVTGNSIAYMTEDYQITTVRGFPYSNNFDLYENSKGDMWILSSNGIYVLPTKDLIANGKMTPDHFGIANGLPCIATSNSYSALSEEGDLYIAGSSGVAKVNIEASLRDDANLKQAVPYLDADGERIYPDREGRFVIPVGTQKLTIYGFVFNYSLTDPQVSYCLEGFDRKPVTVHRSELMPVTYTNLPGGSYRFVMKLKNAMGRERKTLSIPIDKEKALYEQAWFYCVIVVGSLLILSALIAAYVRRKVRILEEEHREEAERERLSNELQMANRIQVSMLPHQFPPFPDRTEFDVFASMDPAREVGGDFYDFFLLDEDHLCLVIADVSGKGIPAALFMMVSKAILHSFSKLGTSAAEILTKTNELLCSNNQTDMFVTVWLGILEINTGRITAANAGHEYPALMKNGAFELIKDRHGLVIGGMDGIKYREYELQLEKGDKLFVYTDGVPEATIADGSMFGTERMLAALNRNPEAAPEQILENVRIAVNAFVKDAEQFDDMTMLCVEYRGSEEEGNGK